jgi:acyl-CoA thioesterase FadM
MSPLKYGDTAIVRMAIDKVGNSSVKFHYRIHRKRDSMMCFEARVTKVFMNLDTGKSEQLPGEIRSLLEGML